MKPEFYNSGWSSLARGYGFANEPDESIFQVNDAIIAFADSNQLHLPYPNSFEAKSELRKPFSERTKGRFLLRELEAGNYGVLIVSRFDLLGKTPLEVKGIIAQFNAHNAVLHILDLVGIGFSTGSDVGKMVEHLIDWAAMAEMKYVRKDLKHTESIQEAIDDKRSQNLLAGTVPYGWNAEYTGEVRRNKNGRETKIRVVKDNFEEQKWIHYMVQFWRAGMSYNKIATDLNRQGVKAKNGGQWQFGQIKKILHSRTVTEWLAKQTKV